MGEGERGPTEHVGGKIVQEMVSEADPETLWRAWTGPEHIARWFVDRAEGSFEEGEVFTWFWDRWGYEVPHEVVVVEAPHRFVIRSSWMGGGPTLLEVRMEEEGGGTRIRVVQSGFDESAEWHEELEGTRSGWRMALGLLRAYAEKHFGRPRSDFVLRREASYAYEDLRPYYHTAEGLGRWLAEPGGEVGEEGDPVRLELRGGGTLTGHFLAVTDTEAALSWVEEDAVLELKAYAHGDHRELQIRGTAWGRPEGWGEEMEALFRPALDRLMERLEK